MVGEGDHAGSEGSKLQCVMVQDPSGLRVGGVVELEPVVELQSVDAIGADPAAYGVASLEHRHINPVDRQLTGSSQASEARTDDDDIVMLRHAA